MQRRHRHETRARGDDPRLLCQLLFCCQQCLEPRPPGSPLGFPPPSSPFPPPPSPTKKCERIPQAQSSLNALPPSALTLKPSLRDRDLYRSFGLTNDYHGITRRENEGGRTSMRAGIGREGASHEKAPRTNKQLVCSPTLNGSVQSDFKRAPKATEVKSIDEGTGSNRRLRWLHA